MGWVIGVDEAGLGPNLGPFVVAATRWHIPDDFDYRQLPASLAAVVTSDPKDQTRLPIVDSKTLFSPSSGLARLEEVVLTLLAAIGVSASTFEELIRAVCQNLDDECPCCPGEPVVIPQASGGKNEELLHRWQQESSRVGVRLEAIHSVLVWPRTFNAMLQHHGNKSTVTSSINLGLVKSVWEPIRFDDVRIFCDKHGGRNRYAAELTEISDGGFVTCLEESALCSRYRVDQSEFQFQPRAEEHLPVALASMTAKYLRELAMVRFNRFWTDRQPGIKPTQGYPEDAKRFREQTARTRADLQISDADFWRSK